MFWRKSKGVEGRGRRERHWCVRLTWKKKTSHVKVADVAAVWAMIFSPGTGSGAGIALTWYLRPLEKAHCLPSPLAVRTPNAHPTPFQFLRPRVNFVTTCIVLSTEQLDARVRPKMNAMIPSNTEDFSAAKKILSPNHSLSRRVC